LKEKLQNDKVKGEKRKKRRKIEKKDAKRCTLGGVISKSGNFLARGPLLLAKVVTSQRWHFR